MSSQDRFSLSSNLLYHSPEKEVSGDLNYVEFIPVSGSSFNKGQNFEVKLSSPDSFIDPTKTWLRYTLEATGTEDAGGNKLTNLGDVSVIKRVDVVAGGLEIESIDNYNHYLSMIYKRQPTEYQNLLRLLEHSDITATVGPAFVIGTTSLVCNHSMRVGLFEGQTKLIPLPFIRGGVSLRFTLESELKKIIATAGNATVTDYTVKNVSVVCGMVKPPPAYLQNYQKLLESGSEAEISMQVVRNLNFTPTSSTTQEAIVNCGYISSLRSVMGCIRDTYTATMPPFQSDFSNNLSSYYFMIGSTRYPLNKQINTSTTDAENLMFALCSVDNTYAHMNSIASNTAGHVIYYNWTSNESVGAGVSVPDAQIRFLQTYSAAPSTSKGPVQLFLSYDAKLKLSASSIQLDALNV